MTKKLDLENALSKSAGRGSRTSTANAKVTAPEHYELTAAAKRDGKSLSEWCRDVLLKEARSSHTERALFTELIAMRQLMAATMEALATGRPMTSAEFRKMSLDLKSSKHESARIVLEQYNVPGGR